MNDVSACPNCGGKTHTAVPRRARGGHGPNYLPGSGRILRAARFTLVVCRDCGLTRFFAAKEARAKLKESGKWSAGLSAALDARRRDQMIRERGTPTASGMLMLSVFLIMTGGGRAPASSAPPGRTTGSWSFSACSCWSRASWASRACSRSRPTRARCCSSSAPTAAPRRRRGCAGRTPSTPRSASRCACATSRAPTSRSTTPTATRSRSPRSWSGGWWTPPRPSSRWTTTRTT